MLNWTQRSSSLAFLLTVCSCSGGTSPTEHPVAEPGPIHEGASEAVASAGSVALRILKEDVWLHTSIRTLEPYGEVISHGLVVRGAEGVVLIDTAWGDTLTSELLVLIEAELGERPDAAVITDFHADRGGGVAALTAAGIAVHTSAGVKARLPAPAARVLQGPADTLAFGGVQLEVFAPGAGHSSENLVVWLPEHQLLFGGCLVRPFSSRGLGNTADADVQAWGPTVRAVLERYPAIVTVVPSHGDPGGAELLWHTLALVETGLWKIATKAGAKPPPMRIAVTVDDLPRHGPLPPGATRTKVHQDFIDAFESHGVPRVWGFVNGKRAETQDERAALSLWIKAGHPLGNHTWSHPDLRDISTVAYLDDIDRNEALLAELSGDPSGRAWKMFRYPYLQQGIDADSSRRIRMHLDASGYQVAEVSIDFWDWDYQNPAQRCRAQNSKTGLRALRRTFSQRAVTMLEWHRAASVQAFERPVAHVLLLHAGAFTAEMLGALLTAYEERGVVWVSLEEALADPVYRDVPLPPKTRGEVILEQAVTSLDVPHPPWAPHPGALLEAICERR